MVGVQAKIAYASLNIDNNYSLLGFSVSEDLLVGIVSAVMTVLVLILSEIIPKTIGAKLLAQISSVQHNCIIIHIAFI